MSQDKLRERLVEVARRRREREAAALDPAVHPAPEALAPLDAEARERIAARVMKEIAPAPTAPTAQPTGRAPGARVLAFPSRRQLRTAAAVVAALAAALVLYVWPARTSPLPAYQATFAGETMVRGSEPPAPARVGPGSVLTLVARPQQPVRGAVEAAAFLVRGDSARPWAAPIQVSAEGAVRISGPADALLPPEPGPWTAVVVISRPGGPRAGVEDALRYSRGEAPVDPGVQAIQVRFEQTGP